MKNEIVSLGIVSRCTNYIKENAPPSKEIMLKTDNPAWKEFSMKPSIKFLLRALVGLASGHAATQVGHIWGIALSQSVWPLNHCPRVFEFNASLKKKNWIIKSSLYNPHDIKCKHCYYSWPGFKVNN